MNSNKNTNQLAIIQQLIRQSENETTFQLKNMSLIHHDILYLTEAIPKYDHVYFTGVQAIPVVVVITFWVKIFCTYEGYLA